MSRNSEIVFVARHTGWTLEYIRKIPLKQLRAFVEELRRQVDVEDYNRDVLTAQLLVSYLNVHRNENARAFTLNDVLRSPGEATEKEMTIWQLAKMNGIRVPSRI